MDPEDKNEDEEDDSEEEEEDSDEIEQEELDDAKKKDITQANMKKLFELRLKMNQARKQNREDVVNEFKVTQRETKRANDAELNEKERKKETWIQKQLKIREESNLKNVDPELFNLYNITAEEADQKEKKNKKKRGVFGWEVFSSDAHYYSYKRRLEALQTIPDTEYQKQKETEIDFYRDANSLSYAADDKITKANVDRMATELEDNIEKRRKFSRHRSNQDVGDMTCINNRNKHYNRKLARAFDPYTIDLKQNLERGTAL